MTVNATQDDKVLNDEKNQTVPDFAEVWKRLYFESEDALGRTIKEFIASPGFVSLLEQMGRQYLSMYKATNQNIDRLMSNHPMPSKKDIARVAELVVSVEDKVDRIESEIFANMAGLTQSLIRLVEFQSALKDEMMAINENLRLLVNHPILSGLAKDGVESQEKMGTQNNEAVVGKRSRRKKNTDNE